MRRWLPVCLVFSAAILAWLLLASWISSGSERFYLLVPPTALGIFLAVSPNPWAHYRQQALRMVGLALALLFLAALFGLMQVQLAGGLPPSFYWEVAVTAYFLCGVILLVSSMRLLLQAVCRPLATRLFGATPTQTVPRIGRAVVAEALPLVLLAALCLPYLMGVGYVHRFKVNNVVTPQAVNRPFEEVSFTTSDGLRLRGWFVPAATESARTVLFCHGIGANRSQVLHYLKVADTLGANVLCFDSRGHGDSDGHTVTLGHNEMQDVLAAITYLREQRPTQAQQVIGLGVSMGASGLIGAAAVVEPPLKAVIIDSGFAVAVDVTDSVLSGMPAALRPWLKFAGVPLASLHAGCALTEVRPVDHLAQIRAPVLIIHCEDDALIPPEHARRLYRAAAEPKQIFTAHTGGHTGVIYLAERQYLREVVRLLEAKK